MTQLLYLRKICLIFIQSKTKLLFCTFYHNYASAKRLNIFVQHRVGRAYFTIYSSLSALHLMAFDIDETFSSNILHHEQKFDRLATHVVDYKFNVGRKCLIALPGLYAHMQ